MADLLVEIATRHAIHMEGVKARYAREFERFLTEMEKDILARLAKVDPASITKARLERLLKAVRKTLNDGFGDYQKVWREQLKEIGAYEAEFEVKALKQLGLDVEWTLPTPNQIFAAAFVEPLSVEGPDQGKLLEAFYRTWTDRSKARIVNAIRLAAAQGQSTDDLVRRIRGTRAAKYRDGLIAATRRETQLMARTALQHIAVQSREVVWDANSRILRGVEWVSVLDSRTSGICRSLDGRVFPLKKGPRPPIHVACRSTVVPRVNRELEALTQGGQRVARDSEDERRNVRVDADLTYYAWLKMQPKAFQDSVIGETRGRLLRNGDLTAERFAELQLDKKFRERTLEEMRELEPLAFERAGI
jgi:SPP1 gp7 family putative phage head morphogenesis protein